MSRWFRLLVIACAAGILPATFLRCDKAALNFQRGLYSGLGLSLSQYLVDTSLATVDQGDGG
jgi:hypothetical protein